MNIEKIQKINQLAQELCKHDANMDSSQALEQAEAIYTQQPKQEQPKLQEQEREETAPQNALETKKIELMLEMNNQKIHAELDKMRDAINEIIRELNSITSRISNIESQQPKERQVPLETPKETEKKQTHPKQGSFSSADVDIQKMFYFGSR